MTFVARRGEIQARIPQMQGRDHVIVKTTSQHIHFCRLRRRRGFMFPTRIVSTNAYSRVFSDLLHSYHATESTPLQTLQPRHCFLTASSASQRGDVLFTFSGRRTTVSSKLSQGRVSLQLPRHDRQQRIHLPKKLVIS